MKVIFGLASVLLLLLAVGCTNGRDARLEELEDRVAALEQHVQQVESQLMQLQEEEGSSGRDELLAELAFHLAVLKQQVQQLGVTPKPPEREDEPAVRVELRGIMTTDPIGMTWDGSITATSGPGKPCSPSVIMEMAEGPTKFGQVITTLEEYCTRLSVNVKRRIDNKQPSFDASMSFTYYIVQDTEEGPRIFRPEVKPTPAFMFPSPTPTCPRGQLRDSAGRRLDC